MADGVLESAGQGSDTVLASVSYQLRTGVSVETLSAVSQTANDVNSQYVLRGNEIAQIVVGNDAANTIDGRGGRDILVGRGGADVFAFTITPSPDNGAVVQDFVQGVDKIGLASDVFAALTRGTTAAVDQNEIGNGNAISSGVQAQTATQFLIYTVQNQSGLLFFDADANGSGAAVLIAALSNAPASLSASDFTILQPVSDLPG